MTTITARSLSRREFLAATSSVVMASTCRGLAQEDSGGDGLAGDAAEKIIDFHQHTNYHGRSDAALVAHQRALGATLTVLLPAGSKHGLAAGCGGNDTVVGLAKEKPSEFLYFANELPDLETTRKEITRYLDLGARGIGEQKFRVACDSAPIEKIATIAKEYGVPVLLHFQHGAYNLEFSRFHRILEKFPTVNFIGHAQTWWGNIDRGHKQDVMYPKGKVTPGGLTDRYLADFANMYGDLSAGSGLNALTRDEDYTREFFVRHQDKLLFATDCADTEGKGPKCQGAQTLATVRRLATDAEVRRKILYENAKKLLKLEE